MLTHTVGDVQLRLARAVTVAPENADSMKMRPVNAHAPWQGRLGMDRTLRIHLAHVQPLGQT